MGAQAADGFLASWPGLHGKFSGRQFAGWQIVGCVNEHLVYGIYLNILRRHILQIYFVNVGAELHIMRHLRSGQLSGAALGAQAADGFLASWPGLCGQAGG